MNKKVLIVFLSLFLFVNFGFTQSFKKIRDNIKEFTLDNGLKFILFEDHSVPVLSFITYVNVGSSDEIRGIRGVSHFLEHMAFKGTSVIGTKDIKKEKQTFNKMDKVFKQLQRERCAVNPNKEKIKELKDKLEALKKEAATYVVSNEFDTILKRNGCVGLNAFTNTDATCFFFSLPSNKIELWAYLESSRYMDPVFREFYKEREVIKEERRVRTENSPMGKLIEELQAVAFKDHSYRNSVVGPMSNIGNITRSAMSSYMRKNYTAKNMVIGVKGDVTLKELKRLAKKYFSKIKPGKRNELIYTLDTPQAGEKSIVLYEESQPWAISAYHCPSQRSKDFVKFSILDYLMTKGRTSRLNKKMAIEDKSVLGVMSFAGLPGSKYPGLYVLAALPNAGHSGLDIIKEFDKELDKLKNKLVSKEELDSAKTRAKADMIKGFKSQMGLIALLESEVVEGSWKKAFDSYDEIDKITAEDIRELAKKYFVKKNRIIARIEKKVKK